MKTITLLGGGSAGLMTAAIILEDAILQGQTDFLIRIFEKNKTLGNKIIISGGGRCNVTTGITDKKILATKYTRGWDFIKKAIGKWGPQKVTLWFESHGVPLKCQEDMRVFPVSNDGYDIVEAFENIFAKYRDNIRIHFGEGVLSVSKDTQSETYTITTKTQTYQSDILVITTGGNAYSHTGSSGDGYSFARALGHTITKLGPSLSSFLTQEKWLHECSGISFETARISGLPSGDIHGAILLTHFGISGPLAFMLSSHLAWEDISKRSIQFIPIHILGKEDWNSFLREQFSHHPKKLIINILSEKLPRRFSEMFIKHFFPQIVDTFAASISRTDRDQISELLGNGIPITLRERRPGDEFVTAGGVSTDEIDPETMESKTQKNLYFAGEVLNVDGYTGGFSLQMCWSSAYSVAQSVIKKLS